MRFSYAVRLEDFRALQPPFVLRPGRNLGFKGVLVACGLIALLGVFCLVEGFGSPVAAFLVCLGVIAAGLAYLYDKRSVTKAKEAYEKRLLTAYRQLHCSDHRVFEADNQTFSAACKCGTVNRPWGELIQLSENENFFSLGTKSGAIVLPKSAFSTEAERTEFRALASSKLNGEKALTSRHLNFTCTRQDLRRAHILHALKGGGWRAVLKQAMTFACVSGGLIVIWRGLASAQIGARFGLVGGALAVVLLRLSRRRPKPQLRPLRVSFGEEGLYLQDSVNQYGTPGQTSSGTWKTTTYCFSTTTLSCTGSFRSVPSWAPRQDFASS